MQEVYHFHQRLLRLILSGYILKGDPRLLLHISLGCTFAHAHGAAFAAHAAEKKT